MNTDVKKSDIFVLGLQEVVEMKSKNIGQIILENSTVARKEWLDYMEDCLGEEFELIF